MAKNFLARPYKYADGVPWNSGRYEIFVMDQGKLVSVGGAIKTWNGQTIAFLCTTGVQRWIRTPKQAEQETNGLYVRGDSLMNALKTLKWKYPEPIQILNEAVQMANAAF